MGPYEIFQKIAKVTYELRLLSELDVVHPVFHVSVIKKCIGDPDSILPRPLLLVPVQIHDRQLKKLRNK